MNFAKIAANLFAILILLGILATPILFAKDFAKIAGVKSSSPYLIVSQVEKFPGMALYQKEDTYTITFEKVGPSQAFLGVLILNNPTSQTKTYSIQVVSGQTTPFFGEDLDNQITKIAVPGRASVPISIYSSEQDTTPNQSVEFNIQTN